MYYQQGDVLLIKENDIPSRAQCVEVNGNIVLAEGESTGHAHVITETDNVQCYSLAEQFFIKTGKSVTITHEEHGPITIEPGVWRVAIVREYDHFAEEARRVMD